jgi:hypothetical protein
MLGRLKQECTLTNLDILISLYDTIILVLHLFHLHSSFQEDTQHVNQELPVK